MSRVRIKLPKGVWTYDTKKPLGRPGGFGAVFSGTGSSNEPVAIKKLHISAVDAAHRELKIAAELASRSLKHVMPILDAGQDAESDGYYIVMPVGERSLQDVLDSKGKMDEKEAEEVLRQIAEGLAEVSDIVHRDLKPSNILLLSGTWRIADFGIARFVEESTSAQTLKKCLSPHFAAPEQWKYEATTQATDIYALGCIAHNLLAGQPPFVGASASAIQEQHLHATPPQLGSCSAKMNALIAMAMRKEPDARPSLMRVRQILTQPTPVSGTPDAALGKLAAAAAAHEAQLAEGDAERRRAQATRHKRDALAAEARRTLRTIGEQLAKRITENVVGASASWTRDSLEIHVGSASLQLDLDTSTGHYGPNDFPRSQWDVICGASIGVEQRSRRPQKRSANLWYTRQRSKTGDYRWFEAAYEGNPLTGKGFEFEPAAANVELADRAHSNAMDVVQVSYGPYAIDDEDLETFVQRWTHILAAAASGEMERLPRALPPKGPY
jgi:serine/threonine-protein kinase